MLRSNSGNTKMKKIVPYRTKFGWPLKGGCSNRDKLVTVEGETQRTTESAAVMTMPIRLNMFQRGDVLNVG